MIPRKGTDRRKRIDRMVYERLRAEYLAEPKPNYRGLALLKAIYQPEYPEWPEFAEAKPGTHGGG